MSDPDSVDLIVGTTLDRLSGSPAGKDEVAPMRRYESGTDWCVWRWTDVDWLGQTYLLRLHILKTPWFALMLHWILTPDPHPDPHDHPVSFLSWTVRGMYEEFLPLPWETQRKDPLNTRRFRFRRATDIHRIIHVDPGTLTLVLAGPVTRAWGFHTRKGWVPWRNYRDEHAR